jgi:hypothetical protein
LPDGAAAVFLPPVWYAPACEICCFIPKVQSQAVKQQPQDRRYLGQSLKSVSEVGELAGSLGLNMEWNG